MTSDINKINKQIEKLEYQIMRSRSEINPARVSAFRYFWPFLVLSIIGAGMAYIYSFVYFFSTPPEERVVSQTVVNAAIIVAFMLIHVIGGVIARSLAAKRNRELQQDEDNIRFTIRKLDAQLGELKFKKMALMGESALGAVTETGDVAAAEPANEAASVENAAPAENAAPVTEAAMPAGGVVTTAAMAGEATDPVDEYFAEAESEAANAGNALTANPFMPQYNTTSEIDAEIKALEARKIALLNAPVLVPRGSFAYFWPFLIISFAAFYGTQVFMMVFSYSFAGLGLNSTFAMYLVPGSVLAMIHIFAGIYARKKRDEYNQQVNEAVIARNSEESKLRERITELEYKKMQMLEKVNASQA